MGGQGHCKMPLLRELARCGCLNVENAVNEVSSAAPPIDRAPQVARSEAQGHGKWGRLSFAYVSLAEQRKVGAPPGAHPGIRPILKNRIPLVSRHQYPRRHPQAQTPTQRQRKISIAPTSPHQPLRQLRSSTRPILPHQPSPINFHSPVTDAQFTPDFLAGQPPKQLSRHFTLTSGQGGSHRPLGTQILERPDSCRMRRRAIQCSPCHVAPESLPRPLAAHTSHYPVVTVHAVGIQDRCDAFPGSLVFIRAGVEHAKTLTYQLVR